MRRQVQTATPLSFRSGVATLTCVAAARDYITPIGLRAIVPPPPLEVKRTPSPRLTPPPATSVLLARAGCWVLKVDEMCSIMRSLCNDARRALASELRVVRCSESWVRTQRPSHGCHIAGVLSEILNIVLGNCFGVAGAILWGRVRVLLRNGCLSPRST